MKDTDGKSARGLIFRRSIVVAIAALVFAGLVIIDLQPYFEYRSKKTQIQRLIPIGSNIDDAPAILDKHGFSYFDKHFATVAEDYYWIDVTVAHDRGPITLTILSFVGVREYFHYVVIEAGLDNKVRKVF